jgi:adenylate cyclase
VKLAKKLGYKEGLAEALYDMGKYHLAATQKYTLAAPCLLQSVMLFEELGNNEGISKCYLQLGLISYSLQYYEDAIKNFELSLSKANNSVATYLMALSYMELANYSRAKDLILKACKEFEQKLQQQRINECHMYLGKLYERQKQFDSAHYFLNLAIVNTIVDKDSVGLSRPYAILSTVFLHENKLEQAIYYAQKAYKLCSITSDEITFVEACTSLSKAYAQKGDYKSAYTYLYLRHSANEEYASGGIKQKVADMQSTFEFRKRMNLQNLRQEKDKVIANQLLLKQKILRNAFIVAFVLLALLLAALYNRYKLKTNSNKALEELNKIVTQEKERSDELLLNILPAEVAAELKKKGNTTAKHYDSVTVMFTDFIGFTKVAERLSADDLVSEIDTCFKAFDHIIDKYNIEKIKTIGDSYMCAGGIPVSNKTHAEDVVRAAIEIRDFMVLRMQHLSSYEKELDGFEIRIGIHTGPVVAGIVGVKKFAYDIWGDTVNVASRMETTSVTGQINISGSTHELVKEIFACSYRGKVHAKNKGEVDMYYVNGILGQQ